MDPLTTPPTHKYGVQITSPFMPMRALVVVEFDVDGAVDGAGPDEVGLVGEGLLLLPSSAPSPPPPPLPLPLPLPPPLP